MAHQLWPTRGQPFLSPDDVVRRLREAFPIVRVDQQRGIAELEAQLAYMRRVAGPSQPFTVTDVDRRHRHRGSAVHVTVVEGDIILATVVEVEEGLFFSYLSEAEERDAYSLVGRVAAVLGYDCESV